MFARDVGGGGGGRSRRVRTRDDVAVARSGRGFEPERVSYLLGLVLELHLDAEASDFLEHDEHLVLPALDVVEELVDAHVGEIPNLVSRATLDDAKVGGEGGGVHHDVVDGDAGLVLGRGGGGGGGGVVGGGVRARGENAARATRGETRPSEASRRGDARDARASRARRARQRDGTRRHRADAARGRHRVRGRVRGSREERRRDSCNARERRRAPPPTLRRREAAVDSG